MKNFLILGLLAALLFSISAALSVWLNQSKHETDQTEKNKTEEGAPKDKESKAVPKTSKEKEPSEPKSPVKADVPSPPTGTESTARKLGDRESRVEERAQRLELVIRDIQSQRETNESLVRQVTTELKNTSGEKEKLDAMLSDLNKKTIELNSQEDANIGRLATMYDSLSPESAAAIIKEMSEKGRMDTAAKIMVKMKERNSARVLEVMEPALAQQLLERMLRLRPPAPAPMPKAP